MRCMETIRQGLKGSETTKALQHKQSPSYLQHHWEPFFHHPVINMRSSDIGKKNWILVIVFIVLYKSGRAGPGMRNFSFASEGLLYT